MAASETAAATAGTTRLSNIEGVMYSSPSSSAVTIAARAWAAASFISSFTRRARTSSMPRRSEEHTSELHHVAISYAVFCLKKKKKKKMKFIFIKKKKKQKNK